VDPGRYGAVDDGRITPNPRVRQIGREYGHMVRGVDFERSPDLGRPATDAGNPPRATRSGSRSKRSVNDVMIALNLRDVSITAHESAAAPCRERRQAEDAPRLSATQEGAASVLTKNSWEEACQIRPNANLTKNAAGHTNKRASSDDLDLVELRRLRRRSSGTT
jgi:hypothetical protein